jgi:organic hydroperoxide reductase OsmC/OhrA
MTARNGSAEWRGSVENGSGTIIVGNGVNIDGAVTLARIDLETDGDVPGIDERQFQAYAEAATRDCPVSRALAGIPETILTAKLLAADPVDVPARSGQ